MSQTYDSAKAGLANTIFVYLNTYVALERWIEANIKDPEMTTVFEGGAPIPEIEAKHVIASAEHIVGAALIGTVSQIGRIVDHFFLLLLKPIIPGTLEDDTWYSPEAIELVSGVHLGSLYGYNEFMHLNLLRGAFDRVEDIILTQPQVLKLAAGLDQFLEDFDAKFHFEQSNRKKTKHGKQTRIGDGVAPGAPGPRALPKTKLLGDGSVRGPADPRPDQNPGYPDEDDHEARHDDYPDADPGAAI